MIFSAKKWTLQTFSGLFTEKVIQDCSLCPVAPPSKIIDKSANAQTCYGWSELLNHCKKVNFCTICLSSKHSIITFDLCVSMPRFLLEIINNFVFLISWIFPIYGIKCVVVTLILGKRVKNAKNDHYFTNAAIWHC